MGEKVITDKDNYTSIANAIRYKNGLTTQYKPSEMANAIKALTGSGTTNPKLQSKTATPSKSRQEITYDSDYDGLEKVTVESIPSNYIEPSGTKSITSNGSYDVSTYASADVNVPSSGIDMSDATAAADNIEKDYTAYVNGEKITGYLSSGNILNLLANSSTYSKDGSPSYASATGTGSLDQPDRISISFTNNTKQIVKNGGTVTASAKATLFGDATVDDVVSGKTFTSKNGLKLTGTHECQGGIDTSDADAVANDIADGKTAYVNGAKVTGNVDTMDSGVRYIGTTNTYERDGSYLSLTYENSDSRLFRSGSKFVVRTDLSNLGNATASDVATGKTFTSSDGITVEGTAEFTGLDTSDANAISTNIETGKTAYVKGEKITGELESISSITQYGTVSWEKDALVLTKKREDKAIFNKTNINLKCSGSDLGDAVAEDVLAGKTFTSAAGLKVVGTGTAQSGGVQKATGTIKNSKIIETGFSSIKSLIIYKSSVAAKGFVTGFYDVDIGKVTYVYCSSYSSYTKNYNYSSNTTFTIDGGTFTWNYGFAESNDEDTSNNGFTSNAEYKWIAYGDA